MEGASCFFSDPEYVFISILDNPQWKCGREVEGMTADVPLAEMFGYANAIRSMSKGRASYSMTPTRFERVPTELASRALAPRQK